MTTHPVSFIDTETLGLDPDRHPVWEVALIDQDGYEHTWQVAITDEDRANADPIALTMTRFDARYNPARAITRADLSFRLSRIPKGTHIVGAVPSFDEERLRRMLIAEGFTVPWHYHLVDVENLAAGWLVATDDGWTTMDDPAQVAAAAAASRGAWVVDLDVVCARLHDLEAVSA